jgi:DNA-directed RNA polymerase specialized sigma24 family protein
MSQSESPERNESRFVETEWSLILKASREGNAGEDSLRRICNLYWFPLYAYLRRRGYKRHDAEDLIQGFFEKILKGDFLVEAAPHKGRFRSFLLISLRNFLVNEHEKSVAEKRGGGREFVELTEAAELSAFALSARADLTPDQVYDRSWALAVLERALNTLSEMLAKEGRADWFSRVRPFLESGAKTEDYESIARDFGMTRNAVAVALHRLNHRYRNLVRTVVAETVQDRGDAEDELAHLLACLLP